MNESLGLLSRLKKGEALGEEEYLYLLEHRCEEGDAFLKEAAREVRERIYGDTVYMSGMIGVDPAVQKPVEGGTLAQARQVFENMKTILAELNGSMDDVLKTTVFLQDLGSFSAVNAVYAEYFGPNYPARSCVEVAKLPMGALVEVEAIVKM